jgi:hypothetical protein
MAVLGGVGFGLISLMFLPVVIQLPHGRFVAAAVVLLMVIAFALATIHAIAAMAARLAASCVAAFADLRKIIIVERPR